MTEAADGLEAAGGPDAVVPDVRRSSPAPSPAAPLPPTAPLPSGAPASPSPSAAPSSHYWGYSEPSVTLNDSGSTGRVPRGSEVSSDDRKRRSSFHFPGLADRARGLGRPDVAAAMAAGLPDWLRADIERRSFENAERRFSRPFRRARQRALLSAQAWAAAAAASPVVAAIGDEWGWLAFGAAALARAGLSFREYRTSPESGLPAPSVPPLRALELRRSAAARPLRRGEAGLAAVAALLCSVEARPGTTQVQTAMVTAARLVDGLRMTARRVLACESAMRAVSDPARRADIRATSARLLAAMEQAADLLDELLTAATEIVVTVTTPTAELTGLADEVERLRTYADGLSELLGFAGPGRPA